ncbi:MAG: 3-hydroxyisobutyrate dehydrogenase [Flavobacteriaceae bacterium]|jgi:3-hydroxyisobutyrate dehydrogenase
MKIAIIGTGIMGSGMATHFIEAGHEVYIWNRTKENAEKILKLGAIWCKTPKEATLQSSMVFEITANDQSSQAVWLGDDGIIAGADKEKFLVTSATLSIKWIDKLIDLTEEYKFLDIPLTGGRKGAETGNLTMLVGGEEDVYVSIKPILNAVAKTFHYFGKRGTGMRFKLLLNMLQAIHISGFAETMKIAEKQGLDLVAVGNALAVRPGGAITELAWKGYQKQPENITFSVDWLTKDLRYVKEFADYIETPLLTETLRQYEEAIQDGKGKDDWSILTKG